jgi:superfamily I DNA and/or RNA helicase
LANEINAKDTAFLIAVLDKATQTLERALICTLASARAKKIILLGDTRQLPPSSTQQGFHWPSCEEE